MRSISGILKTAPLGLLVAACAVMVLFVAAAMILRAQAPISNQQAVAMIQHRDIFTVSTDATAAPPQVFTLEEPAAPGTEAVYLNGLLMAPNVDYGMMGASLQFLPAQAVQAGAIIQVRYWALK